MSYINGYTVYVDGINRTHNAVMPLKWGNFLDERLDEMYLPLRKIKRETFSQLTPVEIILSNKFYMHANKISEAQETVPNQEDRTKYYIVADGQAEENPVGSGFYDHELYLIEVTKYAECVTCDTQTITNDLGRYYTTKAFPVDPVVTEEYPSEN